MLAYPEDAGGGGGNRWEERQGWYFCLPSGIENGDQIVGQVWIHSGAECLHDQVCNGDEEPNSEEKYAYHDCDEAHLSERLNNLVFGRSLGHWGAASFDGGRRDDKQGQDEKGRDAHGPAKVDLADQTANHDREDNASYASACRGYAVCYASLLVEPPSNTGQG